MKRILVFGMTENPGGVESFLVNYYSHIDRQKLQFDFLCNSYNPIAYEEELKKLGGRTFHIPARSQDYFKYRKELENVFAQHADEWSAIWVNVCSLANIDYLKLAKKYGIKKRIIHSHNSQNMDGRIRGILHTYNKKHICKYATDYWACSEDAARWFYDKNLIDKALIIHNAIDLQRVEFDGEKRRFVREQLNANPDTYVIGNVGRLHFQKNQEFAIDVFNQYLQINSNSLLVFVGQGEDKNKLEEKCKKLGIEDNVYFAGVQRDVQAWLSAFDLFLMPSRFEGLSVAALEAQANGVTALVSKGVIPADIRINDNLYFCDLESGAQQWGRTISEIQNEKRADIKEITNKFINKGFDVATEAVKLEKLLLTDTTCTKERPM